VSAALIGSGATAMRFHRFRRFNDLLVSHAEAQIFGNVEEPMALVIALA
jgi:hypothetical protein